MSFMSRERVIEIADCMRRIKSLSSPRIFQTYLVLFDCTNSYTALVNNRLGPTMGIETRAVIKLMIKYNHIVGHIHDDGVFDGIHERKGNLIATCEVDVGS